MTAAGIFRPGMRTYFIPLVAGVVLSVSAFLPWVVVGDVRLEGVPETAALWIIGLGAIAAVLAFLSLITRRNSRHPLLVVGLVALAIMFLSWRIMPRVAGERALILAEKLAILDNTPVRPTADALAGVGIYLGLAASAVIAAFGLTIVVRRASRPYQVQDPNDDVG
jgi:predicted permease